MIKLFFDVFVAIIHIHEFLQFIIIYTYLSFLMLHADVLYLREDVDWVKFNVDMSGYYMVHYAGEGWNSIIKVLQHNHTALTSNDRASLIHNVFQLVRSVLRLNK